MQSDMLLSFYDMPFNASAGFGFHAWNQAEKMNPAVDRTRYFDTLVEVVGPHEGAEADKDDTSTPSPTPSLEHAPQHVTRRVELRSMF